jgi:DNA processing protein
MEAGFRSGSLNTAGHAQGLGRKLGAMPGPITSAASAGCHRLIREFGAALITSADDVLELVNQPRSRVQTPVNADQFFGSGS